jgi:L-ribulokinase
VRSLLLDVNSGSSVCSAVFEYSSGVISDPNDPLIARQNPQDYLDGLEKVVKEVISQARSLSSTFDPEQVIGIGVDTTASSPIPVDAKGTPLSMLPQYSKNINAMVWLWKDHTSYAEAELITETARKIRPQYIEKCGNTYSSEWFWSKILHLRRIDPAVFEAAFSFVEHCDWIPAVLAGNTDPLLLKRSVCAAGHKAMFCEAWDGLPDKAFLAELDPALADLRDRLYTAAYTSDTRAGDLCPEWAARLGLSPGPPGLPPPRTTPHPPRHGASHHGRSPARVSHFPISERRHVTHARRPTPRPRRRSAERF